MARPATYSPFTHRSGGPTSSISRSSIANAPQMRPDGRRLRLRRKSSRAIDLEAVKKEHHRGDDRLAGLVARRLRSLRPAFHPHGVALPPAPTAPADGRGGAGAGTAAFRAAQQLARQRQPGQGPQAAVADQAEVRPQALLGRPDDPHRQRRPRVDGLQDLRFCRRSPRTSGSPKKTSTGAPKASGSATTSATAGERQAGQARWPPCRWA